jgi:site-specific DNA recombinase
MAALDGMVLEHLADRLFTPDRLTVVLQAFVARSVESDGTRRGQLAQARRALTEAERRIDRLLQMVEQGLMSLDDPALKERLETAKNARRAAAEPVKMLDGLENAGASVITPNKIDRIAVALREALKNGDPAFRKAYLRLFVDLVLVGDKEVQLRGPTIALAKAASAGQLPPAAGVVPSFVQEWRPVRDSNPCYQRERLVSWASRRTGRRAAWVALAAPRVKATPPSPPLNRPAAAGSLPGGCWGRSTPSAAPGWSRS